MISGIFINGSNGPFDTKTTIGKGANAAYNAANTRPDQLEGSTIQYTDLNVDENTNKIKGPNIDGAMAYATASMALTKVLDPNTGELKTNGKEYISKDQVTHTPKLRVPPEVSNDKKNTPEGKVLTDIRNTTQRINAKLDAVDARQEKLFDAVDLNEDGKIDSSENTAYTIFQDVCSREKQTGADGTVTPEGRKLSEAILSNPNPRIKDFGREKLNQIYNLYNLDQRTNYLAYRAMYSPYKKPEDDGWPPKSKL